jgi:hypothetical protein
VVGRGYGVTCQVPAVAWTGAADVVAVVGREPADLEAALDLEPDLVLVSLPPFAHRAVIEAVARRAHPIAVVCEKPLAHTVDDARAIRSLLTSSAPSRLAVVDHQLRWSPPRRALRDLLRAGGLGDVRSARAEMSFGSPARMTRPFTWWDERERGGGAWLALGSHLLDGLAWLLGPVVRVDAARMQRTVRMRLDGAAAREVTSDDAAEVLLSHASGALSTVVVSTAHLHAPVAALEVAGTRGHAVLDERSHEGRVRLVDVSTGAARELDARLPTVAEVNACNDSAFARCEPLFLRDVVRAVIDGRAAHPDAATLDDAVHVQDVLDAALRSAREGRAIEVPPC